MQKGNQQCGRRWRTSPIVFLFCVLLVILYFRTILCENAAWTVRTFVLNGVVLMARDFFPFLILVRLGKPWGEERVFFFFFFFRERAAQQRQRFFLLADDDVVSGDEWARGREPQKPRESRESRVELDMMMMMAFGFHSPFFCEEWLRGK